MTITFLIHEQDHSKVHFNKHGSAEMNDTQDGCKFFFVQICCRSVGNLAKLVQICGPS